MSVIVRILGLAQLACMATCLGASNNQQPTEITRVPASAFPNLPRPVVRYLTRTGCTIPQTYLHRKPSENVIRGDFMRKGTDDWAVLCSRKGRSVILVFTQVSATPAAELASRADWDFLQTVSASGQIGFSRSIQSIKLQNLRAGGDPVSRGIDHDGIEDSFLGKGSVVHIRTGDRWRDLARGD